MNGRHREIVRDNGVGDDDTRHETVHHNSEEWVRAAVHTNQIEGVWSLLNRDTFLPLIGAETLPYTQLIQS